MPVSQKVFRVFVSSTFTDMRQERRILQREAFPRLKALCESKGASFQDVDLRWGVNEEAQLDQKTMTICLEEIARCQRLSPKPNFIILLGDKYGWQPVPARIPKSELEQILGQLSEVERGFVKRWYREDLNALPSEYVLQPREGAYLAYGNWAPEEAQLREILRRAAARLRFTEAQRVKYFASATHQEILAGALSPASGVIEPEKHVFAYLRSIRGLPQDLTGKDYIDLSGSGRDVYPKEQLRRLKQELKAKLPPEHVYEYEGSWNDGCVLEDAKAFGAKVYEDLKAVIESRLQGVEEVDPLTREIGQHVEFKDRRIEHFTGRKDALAAIRDYLDSTVNKVFSIIGASGSGKTSVVAKAIDEAETRNGVVVFRFLGTTSATSGAYQLLSGLVRQITISYGIELSTLLEKEEDESKFSNLRGLQEILPRCLSLANVRQPLLIFLDALDQLSPDYAALPLDWMPKEISENAKIIVSSLPELKDSLANAVTYELRAMPATDGEQLLETWLSSVNRTLQPHQKREVMEKFATNGTPLYLKLAFEKAKTWRSYAVYRGIGVNVEGVLDEYFTDLEKDHGGLLVRKSCGYLLAGKYAGLTEQEILDLLVFDEEHWRHFLANCHPAHRQEVHEMGKLPIVIWSRLFLDLEPYLTEKSAEGIPIISFYHRKFIDHTKKRYLVKDANSASLKRALLDLFKSLKYLSPAGTSTAIERHNILADFFEKKSLCLDESEKSPNVRKVVEQPYQQTMARQWIDVVAKSLGCFPFLMAKAKAGLVEGILEDYRFVFTMAPLETKKKLKIWEAFFRERANILRRGNKEWQAYKIFLQLAVEHADESPITVAAEKYLHESKVDWTWIRRTQRVTRVGIDPCLGVLEGHRSWVTGALELLDERILSWSQDKTLRIWDRNGTPIAKLEGHANGVDGAIELKGGKILSWDKSNTLRVWDRNGMPRACIEGYKGFELEDGRILSWAGKVLSVWDSEGKPIAKLEGHTEVVRGAFELRGGRVLSWSDDKSLRIWDRTNKPIATVVGHTEAISGALELRDGRILSWSGDKSLRIWDRNGKPIAKVEGHTKAISGALELRDGSIVYWANDSTLRLWDKNGKSITSLAGHGSLFIKAIDLKDGRILSFPGDMGQKGGSTILWSRHGKFVAKLDGHTDLVEGALQLKDGKILTWSRDKTLRIWDRNGKQITILEGHTDVPGGALELKDGRILSWASERKLKFDFTLRIWDRHTKQIEKLKRHNDMALEILELRDGRILSAAMDQTPIIWDRHGNPVLMLQGHTEPVKGVLELKGGRILTWAWDQTNTNGDYALRIWDSEGKLVTRLVGHTCWVEGAFQLRDGNILSWQANLIGQGGDNTLRIWDREGRPVARLEGHTESVNGAIELTDSRILSWSLDKTLRIWDGNGKAIAKLEGHTDFVKRAIELKDGKILSWAFDKTLRIWDGNGKAIAKLEGHTKWIDGAIELGDGKILSWATDRIHYMWDQKGNLIAKYSNDESLRFRPALLEAFSKECLISNLILDSREYCAILHPYKINNDLSFHWHACTVCLPDLIRPDGRMVVRLTNGEVSFLCLYHGNKPITVRELEDMYGLEYQEAT